VTRAVLADWRTAPVPDGLRATLGYLARLTLEPESLGPADVEAVRAAGVSDEALEDAVHVAALFNVIDRLADALGFHVPPEEAFARIAPRFYRRGYA
jgi:alkylhydroperoxidase family enzyme